MPKLGGSKGYKKKVVTKRRGFNLRGAIATGGALVGRAIAKTAKYRRPAMKVAGRVAMGALAGKVISGFVGSKMRHSNSEGYIPAYSKVLGNTKTGLSFSEKIQKIMNPPQTLLYNTSGKFDATSGTQLTTSFNMNNAYWSDFFTFIQPIRSDNSVVSNTNYLSTSATNRVNHHWTSIQHTFLNSGNTCAELDIYIFQAIQDIDSVDQAITALSAWAYAEQINSLNGVSADGTQTLAKKPTDFSSKIYMRRYWKLLSSNSVQMKAGESYKHYFRQHYNR